MTAIHVRLIGGWTLVDADDAGLALRYPWRITPQGYALATILDRTTSLHRLIADTPPGFVTDHINGDTLDNRRANLRHATYGENRRNTRASRAAAAR